MEKELEMRSSDEEKLIEKDMQLNAEGTPWHMGIKQ